MTNRRTAQLMATAFIAGPGWLAACQTATPDDPDRSDASIQITGGDDWHARMAIPHVPAGGSWIIRGVSFCLDKAGPVTIDRVTLPDSKAAVTAFTLQDNPAWRGADTYGDELNTDQAGTLTEAGFKTDQHDVVHVCDPEPKNEADVTGKGQELLLQVRAPGSGLGRFDGFDVLYHRHGDARRVHVPLEIVLCPGDPAKTIACSV